MIPTVRTPDGVARTTTAEGRAAPSRAARAIAPAIAVASLLLAPTLLLAQPGVDDPILRSVEGIEVIEHLDAQLPLDLKLQDETGNFVPLSSYFDGTRPVILNLAYFSCPMLCNIVVEGLIDAIGDMGWTIGDEFRVLTISIDPRDRPATARARRETLMREHFLADDHPSVLDGWHFLTGREENIRKVADTIGFTYEWNDYRSEYAHEAVIILATPDGRVSRYLYGVRYDPDVLRLSLVEASGGKVGSTFERIYLLCFAYDPAQAHYGPMAKGIMRVGGIATVGGLAILFFALTRAQRRRAREGAPGTAAAAPDTRPPEPALAATPDATSET